MSAAKGDGYRCVKPLGGFAAALNMSLNHRRQVAIQFTSEPHRGAPREIVRRHLILLI